MNPQVQSCWRKSRFPCVCLIRNISFFNHQPHNHDCLTITAYWGKVCCHPPNARRWELLLSKLHLLIKEHVLETQDRAEVDRIKANVEQCRTTLQNLGYANFTFEDFFFFWLPSYFLPKSLHKHDLAAVSFCSRLFLEQLDHVLHGNEDSISHEELAQRSRDQSVSDYVVMFFRFVTSGEIRKRSEFFEPFILGLTNATVEQSDHVHIIALSDALGVPIRVVYLDCSSCDNGGVSLNHHDFVPAGEGAESSSKNSNPISTLLYRPGHYDILYPK
ncbi:LOW QUALITY PROTEIN: Peptidase C65, otubain [Dillenia turbinata]|uniref:Peptidase C65, otubain n=1 Tax=Dillenia turbinata TaxID=194707 RepID=A0AAN8V9C6_9MAGN